MEWKRGGTVLLGCSSPFLNCTGGVSHAVFCYGSLLRGATAPREVLPCSVGRKALTVDTWARQAAGPRRAYKVLSST